MNTREIIKKLCDDRGISVQRLEKELGFSNGSIAKNDSMKSDRLYAISKYFDVSMEFLMGHDNEKEGKLKPGVNFIHKDGHVNNYDFSDIANEITKSYYINDEAMSMAQFLAENPEYKVLFDASRKVKPEDLQKAIKALGIFTED